MSRTQTLAARIVTLLWMATAIAWPLAAPAQIGGAETPEERLERLERRIEAAKQRAAEQGQPVSSPENGDQPAQTSVETDPEPTPADAPTRNGDAQTAADEDSEQRERAARARREADRRRAADEATAALRAAQLEAIRQAEEEAAAALAARREPMAQFRDCPACPEMITLPAGSFGMGDLSADGSAALPGRVLKALGGLLGGGSENRATPVREVKVAKFAIGKYELTFDEWDTCVAAGGCSNYSPADHGWGRGRRPVINISWNQAQQYVLWISAYTGNAYRLPSEAEWEYAARAGTRSRYSFGDTVNCSQAHHGQLDGICGSRQQTQPVGQLAANPWGLFDIHGNVWEWVQDCHNPDYSQAASDASPATGGNCERRMYRGGGWSSSPPWLGSAISGDDEASARYYDLGVRVAMSFDE